jgi:hypothetical protein
MGGKGAQPKGAMFFSGNPTGGGGGGGRGDYSGGRKNIGAWNPGGGTVSSYNKSGARRPDGTAIGSDNGERSQPVQRGTGSGRSVGARAAGTALGTLAGGFLLGGPGAAYGGYKGYQSGAEGAVGDLFNARTGENYRDFLERKGVSRQDTALAAKHGVLERGARDRGYTDSLLGGDDDDDMSSSPTSADLNDFSF